MVYPLTDGHPSIPSTSACTDADKLCFVAPPSYEECTTVGRVDIREDDDNEFVRGELSWCPKYPMYRQLSVPQGASAPPTAPSQVNVDNM